MNKVLIIFILVTCFVFWPMLTKLDSVATSPIDGPLIGWLIHHAAASIRGTSQLFQPPFFYPFENTLTYSDPFLSSGLISVVIKWLWPSVTILEQPNLQFILGTVGYLIALYWLIRVLGGGRLVAMLMAITGTFLPLRFLYVVHLHTYLIFGIPLGVTYLILYTRFPRWRYLFGLAVTYQFQLFNSPMTAYFFLTVVGLYLFSQKKLWRKLSVDRRLIFLGFVLAAISIWFYLPYWQQATLFRSARTIRDTAHFSFSINRLFSWDVLSVLFLNGIFFATSRKSKSLLHQCLPWVSVALAGLFLMLGPVVKINDQTFKLFGLPVPLPYAVIYYLVPGINAFRSVTRWSVLASLGLVLWSAVVFQTSRIKPAVKFSLLAILALFSVISARKFLPIFTVDVETPATYRLAAQQPESVMAIMPMYVWSMVPYEERETVRLLYQPDSNKVYYNGASGFLPSSRAEEIHLHYRSFPDDESINLLKRNGAQLILVEYGQYQKMYDDSFVFGDRKAQDPALIKSQLEKRSDVQLIECATTDCLYRISSVD